MAVDMGAGALPIRPLPSSATPSGVSHDSDLLKEHHAGHIETQERPDATGEDLEPCLAACKYERPLYLAY